MRTSLVLTLIGNDRPGIVEQLANEVAAAGANWEESRMARLAGKFAGLLRVTVDESRATELATRLRALDSGGLKVVVEDTRDIDAGTSQALQLELVGNDRPGIVRDISRVLAAHGVNIEELETTLESAPMSGETLFRGRLHLRMPPTLTVDELRQRLEALAGELMVDIVLDDANHPVGS